MFKVYPQAAELVLEDCRAGASAPWVRVTSNGVDVSLEPSSSAPASVASATSFKPIHAVYGVYSLLSGPYLAVVTDSRVVGSGPNSEKIYCILALELVPVSAAAHGSFFRHASAREQKDERAYCRMIADLVSSRTFYFSYDLDLTLSAQRRFTTASASGSSARARALPLCAKSEEDFFWNKPVLSAFLDDAALSDWVIPVISGFVKVMKKCEIRGQRCDLLFFTRRSWRRVGTRFNVRGVDKDGFVANFAETEVVVVKPDRSVCSYVQIRGSIPLYWDQLATLKYMPRTRYAFSARESIVDWNELAFRAHMDNIIQRYGHVTVVNLIDRAGKSSTVKDQAQLGTAYGKYVKKYNQQSRASDANVSVTSSVSPSPVFGMSPKNKRLGTSPSLPAGANGSTTIGSPTSVSSGSSGTSGKTNGSLQLSSSMPMNAQSSSTSSTVLSQLFAEPIAYVWFDFHHECRKMQWHNLSKLLAEVHDQFAQYGWFECDGEGQLISRQRGVFRVNCMDNLDRTNVVMSLFARRCTLTSLGLHRADGEGNSKNVLDSPYENFELVFKNAWADNADYVSKMYAGTSALKTDFTRTGKRTMTGALQDGANSVTRYYLNNFSDGVRQDACDLLVGNYVPDKRDESPFTFQQQHSFVNLLVEVSLATLVVVSASVSMRPDSTPLVTRVRDGLAVAAVLFIATTYLIIKKGKFRSLGRRYVCKPAFCSSGYIKRKEV